MGGKATKTGKKKKYRDEVEVIEWIDEWWHAAYVDGEEVFVAAHEYGECPVEVYYLPYGEQMFTQTPVPTDRTLAATTPEELMVWASGGNSRQIERRRRALPFAFHQFRQHDMKEALQGIAVTLFKRMRDPAWIHAKDPFSDLDPLEEVSVEGGIITEVGKDDTLTPVPIEVQPPIVAYVTSMIAQNEAMVGLPAQMQGSLRGVGAQTTGTAIDILNASGAEQFWPVAHGIERFLARRAQRRLRLFRDWEPLMGQWGQKGNGIVIPRRNAPPIRLTREAVLRTGTEVNVTLNRFDLTRSAQAATVAQILDASGLAPKISLIEQLGYTTDPQRALDLIAEQQFMEVPDIAQMRLAQWLIDRMEVAKRRGDERSYRMYEGWYAWVDQAIRDQRMLKIKMGGGMAGVPPEMQPGEEGVPGEPPPEFTGGGAQGLSQPMYGNPAGTQGGRPMMPPPAPPMNEGY